LDNAVALTVRHKVGERRDGVVAGSLQDHAGRVTGAFLLILLLRQYKYRVTQAWEELGDQVYI
jgi:hypothetical protein